MSYAYIDSFLKINAYNETQPVSTYDVTMFLPTDIPFDQKNNFVIYYLGNKYKLTAVLKLLGAYKLSVIKDL